MKNLDKKSMTQILLNEMKKDSYSKKEGIYAHLIINVLEEANKFDETLDNVYVNHNIIEGILLSDSVLYYLHDTFGRYEDEFSKKFLTACSKLKEQFESDYPQANSRVDRKILYYTSMGFGIKSFMRKVISKIVFPLDIEIKVQPIFVVLNIFDKGTLNVAWYSGKKHGYYFMQEEFEISRKLKKAEMIMLESEINEAIKSNGYDTEEFEELFDIVDTFISKVA